MEELNHGELKILVTDEEGITRFTFRGVSAEPEPSAFLNPYIDQMVKELERKGFAATLDFRHLEFMNSSTVPAIMRAISMVEQAGIKAEVLYRSDLKWQVASFRAMESVAKMKSFKNVQIRGIEGGARDQDG